MTENDLEDVRNFDAFVRKSGSKSLQLTIPEEVCTIFDLKSNDIVNIKIKIAKKGGKK